MGFSGLECSHKPTLPEKPYFFYVSFGEGIAKDSAFKSQSPTSIQDWEDIRIMIRYFEYFLRGELGVFDTHPAGDTAKFTEAYNFVQSKIDKLTGKEYVPN